MVGLKFSRVMPYQKILVNASRLTITCEWVFLGIYVV